MIGAGRQKLTGVADQCGAWLEEQLDDPATVGVVMLVVELRTGEDNTAWVTYCSDSRAWVQRAAIAEASTAVAEHEADE